MLPLHAVGLSFYIRRCHCWRRVGRSFIHFPFHLFLLTAEQRKEDETENTKKSVAKLMFFFVVSLIHLCYILIFINRNIFRENKKNIHVKRSEKQLGKCVLGNL
jgi:hypothetical protein